VGQWLMDVDGSNSHKVSEGGGWACWAPDGRWLYVATPTPTGFRIEKLSPEGGAPVMVREEGQKPAVARDGTLYFTTTLPALNGMSDMQFVKAKPENGTAQKFGFPGRG
jgi:hypothetical protein